MARALRDANRWPYGVAASSARRTFRANRNRAALGSFLLLISVFMIWLSDVRWLSAVVVVVSFVIGRLLAHRYGRGDTGRVATKTRRAAFMAVSAVVGGLTIAAAAPGMYGAGIDLAAAALGLCSAYLFGIVRLRERTANRPASH